MGSKAFLTLGMLIVASAASASVLLLTPGSTEEVTPSGPSIDNPRTVYVGSLMAANCADAIRSYSWVRACISATVKAPQPIEIQRGSTVTVPVQLSHQTGLNPFPNGVAILLGIANARPGEVVSLGSRPVLNASNPPRTLPFTSYASFVPTILTLKAGEVKEVNMVITIPTSWPEELVGVKLGIPISWGPPQAPYENSESSGVWGFSEEVAVIVR